MRRLFPRLASFVLTLVACPVLLQAQSTDQQRIADIQYVATQLPALHPNFFFQLKPSDFNAAVQSLTNQESSLTAAEFAVRLAQLVAMVGDPHTILYLNTGPTFPLSFRWLDDGVFVTGASAQYSQALATRLVAVGTTTIDDVLAKIGTVIPHTNTQWVQYEAQNYMRVQTVLQGLDLAPASGPTPLTFADASGNQFTLNVTPSTDAIAGALSAQGPLPDFVRNSSMNYWYAYLAPQRLLYFKYNVCENDSSNPFTIFASQVLNTFDSNPADTFVFDLRGNTGGDSSIINPILQGLQQRIPVILANPNFRVYVAIDGGTFSSGLDDAMEVKSNAVAAAAQFPAFANSTIVIGEPSGGPPAGYGEVLTFSLPYLSLSGQYSTEYFSLPPFIPAGNAFNPDVTVSNRSTDYFARHDPVLAAIIARASAPPAAPSGAAIVVNAASFRTDQGIAPGSYAAAFGAFPANVDGVFVNGTAGQIVVATPSQINFIVPPSVASGAATVSVRTGATEAATGEFTVTSPGIGLFSLSADPSQPGAILNQDSSVNTAASPAAQGSVVQIFGTGFAQATQVMFNDTPAQAQYSGPVAGVPGLWQINATLPTGMTGQIPIYAIAGNSVSNAVTLWVQ